MSGADAGQEQGMITRMAKRFVTGRLARRLPIFKVIAVAQVAMLARRHLQNLGPGEARRLTELMRRRRSLSVAEQDELRALTAKLDPKAFAGAAADQLSPVPLPRRFTGAGKR